MDKGISEGSLEKVVGGTDVQQQTRNTAAAEAKNSFESGVNTGQLQVQAKTAEEAKKKKEEDVRTKAKNSFESGVNTGQLQVQANMAEKKKEEDVRKKAKNSFESGV